MLSLALSLIYKWKLRDFAGLSSHCSHRGESSSDVWLTPTGLTARIRCVRKLALHVLANIRQAVREAALGGRRLLASEATKGQQAGVVMCLQNLPMDYTKPLVALSTIPWLSRSFARELGSPNVGERRRQKTSRLSLRPPEEKERKHTCPKLGGEFHNVHMIIRGGCEVIDVVFRSYDTLVSFIYPTSLHSAPGACHLRD